MSDVVVAGVDESGIVLDEIEEDRVVDVLFDGRRIWSFWPVRDGELEDGRRLVRWPSRMVRFLDGRSEVTLREHVSGAVAFRAEVAFGDGTGRIAFVNRDGVPIALDKSNRFHPEFSGRSAEQLQPLIDSMRLMIETVAGLGVHAFPVYGTLLGAIREGDFLGHDSDADLGYVSSHTTPVEVIRESFALQRALAAQGFPTVRYSAAAFRVDVEEADGSRRGLDLFGGFFDGDPVAPKLYMMGEVGHPFRPEWIHPLSTCALAGHEFPAPAQPERLLEVMYGPEWRTPDPAYKFETPTETSDRLDQWFRGLSPYRRDWSKHQFQGRVSAETEASSFGRWVMEDLAAGTHVLDIGAGRAVDALAMARAGFRTTAYDYVLRAAAQALRVADRQEWPLEARPLSLTQLRWVLAEGARVARLEGPRAVVSRHLVDSTTPAGREGLLRFSSMALRGGGRFYAEFAPDGAEPAVEEVALDGFLRLVERFGGTVDRALTGPSADGTVRVVAQW